MRLLFGIGLLVLVLGVISFFVPFPQREDHGVKIGDTHVGVQTTRNEHVPPLVSAVLVLGGAGMMIAGGRGKS